MTIEERVKKLEAALDAIAMNEPPRLISMSEAAEITSLSRTMLGLIADFPKPINARRRRAR